MAEYKKGSSLAWGIVLIVIGGIFLLHQFNIDVWHFFWQSLWRLAVPLILILWGASKLWLGLKERNERSQTQGPDKGHEI